MSVGDRGSTVESHVARLFKVEPPMCSAHHTRLGEGMPCDSCGQLLGSSLRSHSLYRVRLHRLDHACPFACDRLASE